MVSSSLRIRALCKRYGDFVALAPTSLDGAKGPYIGSCGITIVQGLRATCTQPTLPVR